MPTEAPAGQKNTGININLFFPVAQLAPPASSAFSALEASLRDAIRPHGALEEDVLLQIRDAAWRLRAIRAEFHRLFAGAEPLANPEDLRAVQQLLRYRAAAESQLFGAIEVLRELQTTRLARQLLLTAAERESLPVSVAPRVFATVLFDGFRFNKADRDEFLRMQGFLQNEPNPAGG